MPKRGVRRLTIRMKLTLLSILLGIVSAVVAADDVGRYGPGPLGIGRGRKRGSDSHLSTVRRDDAADAARMALHVRPSSFIHLHERPRPQANDTAGTRATLAVAGIQPI